MPIPGLGGMIGGAAKMGAAIFGGAVKAKAMKKVEKSLEAQQAENQNWLDRKVGEDATQRASAQRVLAAMNNSLRNNSKQLAAMQAVSGGTEESVAAQKAANVSSLGDVLSQMNVNAEAQKDATEQQFMAKRDNLQDRLDQMQIDKANNMAEAASAAGEAAGQLGKGISGFLG